MPSDDRPPFHLAPDEFLHPEDRKKDETETDAGKPNVHGDGFRLPR